MKIVTYTARHKRILSMLQSGLTGLLATSILTSVLAAMHSGLLMME